MSHNEAMAGMNNLEMSEKAKPLLAAVIKHIRENVDPITDEYFRLGEGRADRWSYGPGQLELLETAKEKKRAKAGCGTSFCPTPKLAKVCRTSTTPISRPSLAKARWQLNR